MTTATSKTFQELAADPVGTIYHDVTEEGVRFIVMRGPASLVAYCGVHPEHPLAGFNYDGLPVRAHGGLTYGAFGDGKTHPAGWFWYGWDYAHSGDMSFYDLKFGSVGPHDKAWTVGDVVKDGEWETFYEFKKLAGLAEKIFNKAKRS